MADPRFTSSVGKQFFEVSDTTNFARTSVPQQTFVDLTTVAAPPPKISRGGFEVPATTLNPAIVGTFVGGLTPILPVSEPRVLTQSIPKGTTVPLGTKVDITMTARNVIPFDIFEAPHAALKGKLLDAVDPVLDDPAVRETLLKFENPADVPAADKANLIAQFKTVHVDVNDASPDTSFNAAFQSMRGALAFR